MADLNGRGFEKGRLQSLSDGIFSIVMTLLVLELISIEVTGAGSASELHKARGASGTGLTLQQKVHVS